MKTITLSRAIEQGRYDVAAHLVVIGLVQASKKEAGANGQVTRRAARQPKRS